VTNTANRRGEAVNGCNQHHSSGCFCNRNSDDGERTVREYASIDRTALAGTGGTANGHMTAGFAGAAELAGAGKGSGLDLIAGGPVVIDNTTVIRNDATTSDPDVSGTFST
jgi:hypothetical protein